MGTILGYENKQKLGEGKERVMGEEYDQSIFFACAKSS
jgi:hypothetical protein